MEKLNEQLSPKRRGIRDWDRENMRSFTCRVRSYEAVEFQEYCARHKTTPYRVLKDCIMKCIENGRVSNIK